MSPRNIRFSKLSMEEKGKAVTIEIDDEEEDLQALNAKVEEAQDMEEDIQPVCSATKLLEYVPPRKGKTKIPKDLDATKSVLQTLLLPNGIVFEGSHLGYVPIMKFEYWDLKDNEKFPHLETESLMKQSTEGPVITLELRKWLHSVEKAGLLHLLWIPHFNYVPITIFIIRQLLCLLHDGYLWLEEPILNMWLSSIEFLGFPVRERTPR